MRSSVNIFGAFLLTHLEPSLSAGASRANRYMMVVCLYLCTLYAIQYKYKVVA